MRNRIRVIAALAAMAAVGPVSAQTASSALNVSVTVTDTGECFVSASDLVFPPSDGSAQVVAPLPNAVQVNCTNPGTEVTLAFDAGLHADPITGNRRLQNPAGDEITYGIFDETQTIELGDNCGAGTYPAGECFVGTLIGTELSLGLVGVLLSAASGTSSVFTPGTTYTDIITVEVSF